MLFFVAKMGVDGIQVHVRWLAIYCGWLCHSLICQSFQMVSYWHC